MTYIALAIGAAIFIRCVVVVIDVLQPFSDPIHPTQSEGYLGVYEPDAPGSYTGIDQFAQAIGRQPNLVAYYSHWLVPFDVGFATSAAKHGAVTLVQIAPRNMSLASIASGRYDAYLRSYALAVKAFGAPVILSFGHEMNGHWYPWGYPAYVGDGIRSRVATCRNHIPRAWNQECHLAVDGQHRRA